MIICTVKTIYNKKVYVIDDLDFSIRVDSKFKSEKTGDEISFIDYYTQSLVDLAPLKFYG